MNDLHKHFTAKALRTNFTDTERLLWKYLRAKQMQGCKFRRQEPIGSYIVDFVCQEKRIVIEVDGGQHSTENKRDNERDKWLKGQGYKVLRFWNNEVLANTEGVLEVIRDCLNHPPLTPPLKGGEINEGVSNQGRRNYGWFPQKSLKNQKL
jgi:very-short-patch-repair endonuclease